MLYFAVIVYSHYKNIQEEEEKKYFSYGIQMPLSSQNFSQEQQTFISNDNPSFASSVNWGTLTSPSYNMGPASQPLPSVAPNINRSNIPQTFSNMGPAHQFQASAATAINFGNVSPPPTNMRQVTAAQSVQKHRK
jgi:hypothetical protein